MKKILTTLLLALLPARVFAQAQTLQQFGNNLESAAQTTNANQLPVELYRAVSGYISSRIFPLLISSAVAIAVLFLMYGALQYFTAYGDENRATNAKKTITYAFIGLIIAFMAMGIAGLVEQSVTSRQSLNAQQAPVR